MAMKKLLTITVCIFFLQDLFGTLTLDLAKTNPGASYTQTITPQEIKEITLENAFVTGVYSISIEEQILETKPFIIIEGGIRYTKCKNQDEFDALVKEVKTVKFESNIPKIKEKLKNFCNKTGANICEDLIEQAKEIKSNMTKVVKVSEPIDLERGEMVTITVKRDTNTWVFTYKTKPINQWSVLWGFTYIPNWLSSPDHFFAKADSGNAYIVTKQSNEELINKIFTNITPTLMFTYKSTDKFRFNSKDLVKAIFSNHFYQLGLTGGISLDLSNPTAMISPSIIFGDNLSLNAGIVFTQKYILDGRYKAGDRIFENLTFEQLHEKQYMPEFFLSIAFRFDKNIFSSSGSTTLK